MKLGISVITCTYNPELRLLERVMGAIEGLDTNDIELEYILIDNNSNPALHQNTFIQDFLNRNPWANLKVEKQQGLIYARICGYKTARFENLLFFDDDNIPESNYLQSLVISMKENPQAGVIGPGKVEVKFIDGAPTLIEQKLKHEYQERHFKEAQFGATEGWAPYFPTGSGMYVKKEVFNKYYSLFIKGGISFTGRNGKSLTSCDDAQIIWTAIKNNYLVGVDPSLSINHLIPQKRASFSYLEKMSYTIAMNTPIAMDEIFNQKGRFNQKEVKREFKLSMINLAKFVLRYCYNWPATIKLARLKYKKVIGTYHGKLEVIKSKQAS